MCTLASQKVVILALSVRAAPMEEPSSSAGSVSSVDLKKPNETPKLELTKMQSSKTAAPPQDIKPKLNAENTAGSDGAKEDVDKKFLYPGK